MIGAMSVAKMRKYEVRTEFYLGNPILKRTFEKPTRRLQQKVKTSLESRVKWMELIWDYFEWRDTHITRQLGEASGCKRTKTD
jgi:hypothetical protein